MAKPGAAREDLALYEDAILHLLYQRYYSRFFEAEFGQPPRGMWPAEGAVSRDFADLLAQAGCDWIASGEGVLVNSLRSGGGTLPERSDYLYQAYRLENGRTATTCFFRDDRLSDLIGFEYAKWHGKDAAAHFVAELKAVADRSAQGKRPVVSVIPFDDEDEAVALANDSTYGLAATAWTKDLGRAHRIAKRLKAGTVGLNCQMQFDHSMPFGGYKQSGWGYESGKAGLDTYLQTKIVWAQM